MQTKKGFIFACAALIGSSTVWAQDWKVGGNALTAPGKLGATTSQNVEFISNNVVNGVLNKSGRWGFGLTSNPSAKVQINSAATEDAFRVQVGGNTKLVLAKNGGLTVGANNVNPPVVGLFVEGSTGIGTSTPLSKFHVRKGSSGITPYFESVITAEGSSNAYMSILAPSSKETGILFGTSSNNVSGGIIYNSSFQTPATNGLQFRTDGNIPRMVLTNNGMLNIGPGSTDDYRLRVDHSGELGLDIANSGTGTDWELFAGSGGLNLFADGGAGGPKGVFNRSTGVYSALSDERAKTNIKPMAGVLEKVRQLKPSSYQFKEAKNGQEQDGFVAQEVMKVFPGLVVHNVDAKRNVDVYMLNYSGFGVIAIKAIQELMQVNEEKEAKLDAQQKQIDNLQKQIEELKSLILRGTNGSAPTGMAGKGELANTASALLEQNTPNPFASSTTIRYTLPQKFTNAQVVITDKNGNALKRIAVSGMSKGAVTVDASSLLPGSYNYSLIVDGKSTGSKQMIVIK